MLKKLAPYTRGYRWYILLGVLCSVGESVLELELPRAMSEIVDVGIANGDLVRVVSKRGHTITRCQETDRVSKGATYMTYQWWIGKCNELTIHKVDPVSHTPEDKFSACQVDAIADQVWRAHSDRSRFFRRHPCNP